MSCRIKTRRFRTVPVITVSGELTAGESSRILRAVTGRGTAKSPTIVIDLSEISLIDSHGIGSLMHSWRMMNEEGRELVLLDPPPFFQNILNETNLRNVIRIIDSLDAL